MAGVELGGERFELRVKEHRLGFRGSKEVLTVLLAQVSPAFDPELLREKGLIRCRDPGKQAEKIRGIIEYAVRNGVDLVIFPELAVPFDRLPQLEEAVAGAEGELVVNLCCEHVPLRKLASILSPEEREEQGLTGAEGDPRMANFCRILVKTRERLHAFTQLKLTPFSGEFSLSAHETLFCGRVLHKFVTDWGNFVFLICKDYVGEVSGERRVPMFDFLKTLTEGGLHYIFVSAINPEPEAFVHAARAFYYLSGKERLHLYRAVEPGGAGAHRDNIPRPTPSRRPAGGGYRARPPVRGETRLGHTPAVFPKGGAAHPREAGAIGPLQAVAHQGDLQPRLRHLPARGVGPGDRTGRGGGGSPGEGRAQSAPEAPTNLPVPTTPFVGREEELAEITGLLEDPTCRLITLVGPGGMGKTRLALEVTSRKRDDFPQGVLFVPLENLRSVDHLVPAVAESLGFSFRGEVDPEGELLDYPREKEMLLIFDNFEHLLEGARIVAEISRVAPGVKLVVTSRERLNLQGEWVVEVRGLTRESALELFVQGARKVRPDFAPSGDEAPLVARICGLVGWMPLAIELAAPWLRVLTLEEIEEEIRRNIDFLTASYRDIPARHRSLRAVFDHSWELLSEEERGAFRKLSVFRGGFGREAAREVAGVSLPILASLVDKSLLLRDEMGRYGLHELLRGYGREKLRERAEEELAVRRRHCRYYAAFAGDRAALFGGSDEERALEELRDELENLQLAWEYALSELDVDAIAGLMEGLFRFYGVRGRYQEGKGAFMEAAEALRRRGEEGLLLAKALARAGEFHHALGESKEALGLLEEALALAREAGDPGETAFASISLGKVEALLGDYARAEELLREALSIGRGMGDRFNTTRALNALGTMMWHMGRFEEAEGLYRESLSVHRDMGHRRGIAVTLNNLGIIQGLSAKLENAWELFLEGLAISEKIGDLPSIARCLNNLGIVATKLGNLEEAKRFHERGLAIEREIGNRGGIASSLSNLGDLAYRMGEYEEAKRLYLESLSERRAVGDSMGEVISLMSLGGVCVKVGEEDEGHGYLQEALGKALAINAVPLVLGCLAKTAGYLLRRGEGERAAELLGLVLHHPALEIDSREDAESILPQLRAALPAEELERAMERGSRMDLYEVARSLLS